MNDNQKPIKYLKPEDIIGFWYRDGSRDNWFEPSETFDELIRTHYSHTIDAALEGALDHWLDHPDGMLALIIILDQFTRNLFRESANAFKGDERALEICNMAIDCEADLAIEQERRQFIYMPLMHAEDLESQIRCLNYAQDRVEDGDMIIFSEKHLEIIEKFGRFPYRNRVLGRQSTIAELAWLDQNEGF